MALAFHTGDVNYSAEGGWPERRRSPVALPRSRALEQALAFLAGEGLLAEGLASRMRKATGSGSAPSLDCDATDRATVHAIATRDIDDVGGFAKAASPAQKAQDA